VQRIDSKRDTTEFCLQANHRDASQADAILASCGKAFKTKALGLTLENRSFGSHE